MARAEKKMMEDQIKEQQRQFDSMAVQVEDRHIKVARP